MSETTNMYGMPPWASEMFQDIIKEVKGRMVTKRPAPGTVAFRCAKCKQTTRKSDLDDEGRKRCPVCDNDGVVL